MGKFACALITAIGVSILTARIGLAGPVEDFKSGFRALNRGDHTEALRIFRSLAAQGISGAEWALGGMYLEGKGVPRDHVEAMKWHRRAADKGHVVSQFELGAMYDRGLGTRKDYVEAAKWYRRSAEQGYGKAQLNLGVMYATGEGVPRDTSEAYKWLSLAAAGGDYLHTKRNEIVKKDATKRRDRLARRMTAEQLAKGQQLVRDWRPKTETAAIRGAWSIFGSGQRSAAGVAADFILSTCYEAVDDVSRVKSYARLTKWQPLPKDVKNIMKPANAKKYEAWLVKEGGQQFIVGVNEGQFRGKRTQVCQISVNLPAKIVVSRISKKIRLGKGHSRNVGLQVTDMYQLLEHPSVRLGFMIVGRSKDGRPPVNISFMGVP